LSRKRLLCEWQNWVSIQQRRGRRTIHSKAMNCHTEKSMPESRGNHIVQNALEKLPLASFRNYLYISVSTWTWSSQIEKILLARKKIAWKQWSFFVTKLCIWMDFIVQNIVLHMKYWKKRVVNPIYAETDCSQTREEKQIK
jgi:hypothetical protein